MFSIDSGEKEVVLTINNGGVTQFVRVAFEGASYYVEELLISYYDMYERHKHTCKIRDITEGSDIKPTLDWRKLCNTMMDSLVRKSFNAIQYSKADEKMVTMIMDVSYYMFADIHAFYKSVQD